jgi:hypothetical protein
MNPRLHVQLFMPGPIILQQALLAHPWLPTSQLSTGSHSVPLPVQPVLHTQLCMPGPAITQFAFSWHSPTEVPLRSGRLQLLMA